MDERGRGKQRSRVEGSGGERRRGVERKEGSRGEGRRRIPEMISTY